jgi:hypothetical protein
MKYTAKNAAAIIAILNSAQMVFIFSSIAYRLLYLFVRVWLPSVFVFYDCPNQPQHYSVVFQVQLGGLVQAGCATDRRNVCGRVVFVIGGEARDNPFYAAYAVIAIVIPYQFCQRTNPKVCVREYAKRAIVTPLR